MPLSPFKVASYPNGIDAFPDMWPMGRSKRIGKSNSWSLSIMQFFSKSYHSRSQESSEKLPNPIPAISVSVLVILRYVNMRSIL